MTKGEIDEGGEKTSMEKEAGTNEETTLFPLPVRIPQNLVIIIH
jgi:hypothetical protein